VAAARTRQPAACLCAAVVIAAGPASSPVTGSQGQRLARTELSNPVYHPRPPLIQRIEEWLGNEVSRLLNHAGLAAPGGGWWAITALAVLLVLGSAAVLIWIGPVMSSRAGRPAALLPGSDLSARAHRELADRLADAGDFTGATIELVRAVALELEERGLLATRVSRTADELAADASVALPGQADGFRDAARQFDDIAYGGRDGTAAGYGRLRELDRVIRAAGSAVAAVAADGAEAGHPLAGAAAGPVS
jgi:Domain of unknown function (DUF4129)